MSDAPLTRDAFLSHVGKLAEEAVDIPEMGRVLCRELDGAKRALVLMVLAPAATSGEAPDFRRYQELLLQHGLVDPDSPADKREPLLDLAGARKAMELGGSKVEKLCAAVERLSGLTGGSKAAVERAEGNSDEAPSSSPTSE